MGRLLADVADDTQSGTTARRVRTIALTGCRRGEIILLKSAEVDPERNRIRLEDSKGGASIPRSGSP